MSGTLHAIKNAATTVVEVDPLSLRVRKVKSSDIASVGFAALTIIGPDAASGDTEAAEEMIAARIQRMSPKQMGEITEMQSAVVCAGVMAISADGGETWDQVSLVMDYRKEDIEKGRLCVHSLPPGVAEACFTEIMSLSTSKEEAGARLRAFLGAERERDPDGRSQSRTDLQPTSVRDTGS